MPQIQSALQDIAENLQIESDFRIVHPKYKPIELPDSEQTRIKQIPQKLQDKFLSSQLRNFIYGIYYNGSLRSPLALDTNLDSTALQQKLENNTFLGIDLDFFAQLHKNNCGQGYFQPGWRVIREESENILAVKASNLTLHINRERHLQDKDRQASVGDIVSIWTPSNRLQNGFYVAIANVGLDNPDIELVRVYFNINSQGAASIMRSITQHLNDLQIHFTFKVLYNPSDYDRYDSGVLYFDKSDYKAISELLTNIYQSHQNYFRQEVPLFTKCLAPGLSLAEEPKQKFARRESFGMNRCQIIANALLSAWQKGKNSTSERLQIILEHFTSTEIDLQRSYLNPNSSDIYTVFQ